MAARGGPRVNGDAAAEEPEVEPPDSWPPAVAERYERHGKVGAGMFGEVHAAWDRVGKRAVAVKRLAGRTDGRFVRTGLRELAREAMSLAACRGHPSVVELVATHADGRRSDGDCFVVTELAGTMNLRQYMRLRSGQGRPFAESEVREAMRQLLAGVECAHTAGVLHRDIAPENVVVDEDERRGKTAYRICGFGSSEPAARAGEDDSSLVASQSPYRAPELFLGSRDYDGRVDTWGLGCVMAELLAGTGAPFFGGASDAEVLEKVVRAAGAKGIVEWAGLARLTTRDRAARLRELCGRDAGHLRELLPPEALSPAGFEVLSGLLESNPERRLTAAAALRMPWFHRRRRRFGGCFGFASS